MAERQVPDGFGGTTPVVDPRETGEQFRWALSICGARDRVYGPDTPCPIGEYVEVRLAADFDALLADLQGEVERLRGVAASMNADPHWTGRTSPVADAIEAWSDQLQALIDKHSPSSEPSTEEVAAEAAAPERSSESGD